MKKFTIVLSPLGDKYVLQISSYREEMIENILTKVELTEEAKLINVELSECVTKINEVCHG